MSTSYDFDLDINCPIGLKNILCKKIVLFNVQSLLFQFSNSSTDIHSKLTYYILETLQVDNPVVTNLRDLVKEIDKSNGCIDTFRCVHELGIPDCVKNT